MRGSKWFPASSASIALSCSVTTLFRVSSRCHSSAIEARGGPVISSRKGSFRWLLPRGSAGPTHVVCIFARRLLLAADFTDGRNRIKPTHRGGFFFIQSSAHSRPGSCALAQLRRLSRTYPSPRAPRGSCNGRLYAWNTKHVRLGRNLAHVLISRCSLAGANCDLFDVRGSVGVPPIAARPNAKRPTFTSFGQLNRLVVPTGLEQSYLTLSTELRLELIDYRWLCWPLMEVNGHCKKMKKKRTFRYMNI